MTLRLKEVRVLLEHLHQHRITPEQQGVLALALSTMDGDYITNNREEAQRIDQAGSAAEPRLWGTPYKQQVRVGESLHTLERLQGRPQAPALVSNHVVMLLCDHILRRETDHNKVVDSLMESKRDVEKELKEANAEAAKAREESRRSRALGAPHLLPVISALAKALDLDPAAVLEAHQEDRLGDLLRQLDGWDGPIIENAEL